MCEGSHDFVFLSEVVDELLVARGLSGNTFTALQPRIDATSQQLDGGGYEAVCQWLINNQGIGLRNYLERALFNSSIIYDYILIQLDGDVADLSIDFKNSAYNAAFGTVADRVSAVRGWALSLFRVEPAFSRLVMSAIPTLQMEAWVLAGIVPTASSVESRNRKLAAKRVLKRRFPGPAVDRVRAAGQASRAHLAQMRSKAISFDLFCGEVAGLS